VRHRDIRQAIQLLRDEYGDWPLTHPRLATTNGTGASRAAVLVEREGEHYDVGERPWQRVVAIGNLRRMAEDLNRGGWVVGRIPDLEHVQVDPDRLGGRPVVRCWRIAAEDVALMAEAPGGMELLRRDYELTDD
jgi:hypothetical protein